MNLERIMRHRGVLLAALKAYEKRVTKVNKEEEDLEIDADDSQHTLDVIEELRAELNPAVGGQGIEGTPLGDMIAGQVFKAEDGAELTVEALDNMLDRVGVDADLSHIGAWTLEQRKQVHAWVKAREIELLENVAPVDRIAIPDLIAVHWFVPEEEIFERDMPEDEVDHLISLGPWGVRSTDPTTDDWSIVRGGETQDDGTVAPVVEYAQRFGQVDRARLIAANLNELEQERTLSGALVPAAADDSISSNEAPVEQDPQAEAPEAETSTSEQQTGPVLVP